MTKGFETPSKEQFKDWMAMWHVEIDERERHLWPNKWIITGWYAYEKHLYKNIEYKWGKEEDVQYDNRKKKTFPEELNSLCLGGEDFFRWNVVSYSWSLHKDGIWRKNVS